MIDKLMKKLTYTLKVRKINVNDKDYMERYYFPKNWSKRWFFLRWVEKNVFINRILSGDSDRHFHDHPWSWAYSVILSGGYYEERIVFLEPNPDNPGVGAMVRRFFPFKINFISCRDFHRIIDPKPNTWTLFIHGRKIKNWGFLEIQDDGILYKAANTSNSPPRTSYPK